MKNKYWLDGGLIVLSLYIAITIVLYSYSLIAPCNMWCVPWWMMPSVYAGGFVVFEKGLGEVMSTVIFFMIPSLVYFTLGSIIGLLFGKIKSRKKS